MVMCLRHTEAVLSRSRSTRWALLPPWELVSAQFPSSPPGSLPLCLGSSSVCLAPNPIARQDPTPSWQFWLAR